MSRETWVAQYQDDEFALLRERLRDYDIPWGGRPSVERVDVVAGSDRRVSAIRWRDSSPEIVLLHGGAQNAHTWDAVALALDRPLLCIDLPGHGFSEWREDHAYRPRSMAPDVADAITALAPNAQLVVGMSLGGMTAVALADARPELVRRLAVVDIAPGADRNTAGPLFDFIAGPETFAGLDEIVDRAVRFSPKRSRDSLLLGVLHNARQQEDGTWRWRYDPAIGKAAGVAGVAEEMKTMWDAIERVRVPTLLVKGAESPAVSEDAIREWRRLQPGVRIDVVEGAGHAVQSDKPVILARLLEELLTSC